MSESADPSEPFGAAPEAVSGAVVIDVRRAAAYAQADTCLPGARWRDPAAVADWAAELPRGMPVLVYCVHGHEVSRGAAMQLRVLGIDARFLRGGISAWQAAGLPLAAKA